MAGLRTCRNTGGTPINDSGTPVPIPAVFCAPTAAPAETPVPAETPAPAQAQAPTPTSACASVSGPPERYTDEDLQRATKLALESFVKGPEHGQLQASSGLYKQLLKARFSNLY